MQQPSAVGVQVAAGLPTRGEQGRSTQSPARPGSPSSPWTTAPHGSQGLLHNSSASSRSSTRPLLVGGDHQPGSSSNPCGHRCAVPHERLPRHVGPRRPGRDVRRHDLRRALRGLSPDRRLVRPAPRGLRARGVPLRLGGATRGLHGSLRRRSGVSSRPRWASSSSSRSSRTKWNGEAQHVRAGGIPVIFVTVLGLMGLKSGALFQNSSAPSGSPRSRSSSSRLALYNGVPAAVEVATADRTSDSIPEGMLAASLSVLFSYGGWQLFSYVAPSVKDPQRNLPGDRHRRHGRRGHLLPYQPRLPEGPRIRGLDAGKEHRWSSRWPTPRWARASARPSSPRPWPCRPRLPRRDADYDPGHLRRHVTRGTVLPS